MFCSKCHFFIYLSNDLLIDSDAATAVSSVEYDILRLVGYGKMGHIYIYISWVYEGYIAFGVYFGMI